MVSGVLHASNNKNDNNKTTKQLVVVNNCYQSDTITIVDASNSLKTMLEDSAADMSLS
jgi:hypothetical protein